MLVVQVYVWQYSILDKAPAVVLKTSRSLRAIHFHPYGAPLLLTAEVVERKVSPPPDDAAWRPAPVAPAGNANNATAGAAPVAAANGPPAEMDAATAAQAAALRQLSMLVYSANHASSSDQQQALLHAVVNERNALHVPLPPSTQTPSESASQPESAGPQPLNQNDPARNTSWWDWWYGPQRRQLNELDRQRQQSRQAGSSTAARSSRPSAPAITPDINITSPIIPLMPAASEAAAYEMMWGWEVSHFSELSHSMR